MFVGNDKAISKYVDLNKGLHQSFQQFLFKDHNISVDTLDFCSDFPGYTIQLKIQEEKVKFSEPPKFDTSNFESEISSLKE